MYPMDYYYTITTADGIELVVLRDETPPHKTGGTGGWEVINRRRRKGLTTWRGRDPLSMELPVLFDGWFPEPESVDADCGLLTFIATGDDFIPPPTVTVDGFLPAYGVTWVIQDIQWGTNVVWINSSYGEKIRVRQDAVIQLLQYVEEDVVKILNKNPKPSTVKAQQGDTLKTIAKRTLGNANKWQKIRDANPGLRDPNANIPPGTTVVIPSK